MKKNNRNKPTMRDVTNVIGNLLAKVELMDQKLKTVDALFRQYVDYNKDGQKFNEFINKKLEEFNESDGESSRESNERGGKAKVKNIGAGKPKRKTVILRMFQYLKV